MILALQSNGSPVSQDREVVNFVGPTVSDVSGVTKVDTTTLPSATALNYGRGTVTQATSISTGVTVNSASGVITTVSATTAAGSTSTFTVTNSCVAAASAVVLSLGAYSGTFGTNGTPIVSVSAVAAGSFDVKIFNAHATNALSGTLKLHFLAC